LTLNPDGTITGTPTTAATSNVAVIVTDAAVPSPLTATRTLSIGTRTAFVLYASPTQITARLIFGQIRTGTTLLEIYLS
jgi:hypothetical protein